uniref:Transcriptional regulator n=1 Tax=Macrostomum lignano TaxID=282301 RepID=A0A1I8G0F8_9PLAT
MLEQRSWEPAVSQAAVQQQTGRVVSTVDPMAGAQLPTDAASCLVRPFLATVSCARASRRERLGWGFTTRNPEK